MILALTPWVFSPDHWRYVVPLSEARPMLRRLQLKAYCLRLAEPRYEYLSELSSDLLALPPEIQDLGTIIANNALLQAHIDLAAFADWP